MRLRAVALALRGPPAISQIAGLSAVIEDTHEPRLKVKDENARPNASKGLTAIFSLQTAVNEFSRLPI